MVQSDGRHNGRGVPPIFAQVVEMVCWSDVNTILLALHLRVVAQGRHWLAY